MKANYLAIILQRLQVDSDNVSWQKSRILLSYFVSGLGDLYGAFWVRMGFEMILSRIAFT